MEGYDSSSTRAPCLVSLRTHQTVPSHVCFPAPTWCTFNHRWLHPISPHACVSATGQCSGLSRHGGLCLGPGDTSSASRARQALRAAGVPLAAAESAHDGADAEDDNVGGGRRTGPTAAGSGDASSAPIVSRSSSRPPSAETTGSCRPRPSSPGFGRRGTVLVVGEHGRCPWATAGIAPCDPGGAGGGGDREGERDDEGEACNGTRAVLQAEGRAEVVSLLWVEVCHRGGELRPPVSCEKVFRPQPWPIRTFLECRSSAAVVGGRGEDGCSRRRFPAIAVRRGIFPCFRRRRRRRCVLPFCVVSGFGVWSVGSVRLLTAVTCCYRTW